MLILRCLDFRVAAFTFKIRHVSIHLVCVTGKKTLYVFFFLGNIKIYLCIQAKQDLTSLSFM